MQGLMEERIDYMPNLPHNPATRPPTPKKVSHTKKQEKKMAKYKAINKTKLGDNLDRTIRKRTQNNYE